MKEPFLLRTFSEVRRKVALLVWTGFVSVIPVAIVVQNPIHVNNNYSTTFLCVLLSSLRESVFCLVLK